MTSLKQMKKLRLASGVALQAMVMVAGGVAAGVMLASPAVAQDYTRGVLSGTVLNVDGAPVAGAEVTVTSTEQGFTNKATTDAKGSFLINALPTGIYQVRVTSNGQLVYSDAGLSVAAGSTSSYRFTAAEPASAKTDDGTIVVVGSRLKINDFAATTTGLSIDVANVVENVPIPRTQSGVILLAPGTTSGDTGFGDLVSFGGATVAENSYYVNGLNTTNFRTFVGNNTVPFEFYRTVDVKTGGWSAEYGRAIGGVTSAVVKSGSNDFEAGIVATYAPNWLRKDSPDTYRNASKALKELNSQDTRNSYEANIYASGPIIKDRLFFYALYTPGKTEREDTSVTGGYRFQSKSTSPFFGGKLDGIITDGHRVELTFFRDKNKTFYDYLPVDPVTGAVTGSSAGTEKLTSGGNNFIAQYTGQFTDWFTLSAAYGENNYARGDVVVGDNPQPIVQSFLNGSVQTVSGIPVAPSDGQDKRKVYRVDADVYANFLGNHHFRFGVDREDLSASENTFYTGDYIYRYYASYIRARYYLNAGDFSSKQTAFYLQDSWNLLNDRLNLQLGVRNDRFDNYGVTGEKYLSIKNQWAPRLGASFDVFGDKLTKLNAFWGRYYFPVATNTNIRLAGAETYYEQRFAYPVGVVPGTPLANGAPSNAQTKADGAPVLGALTSSNINACPAFGPGSGQLCRTVFSDGVPGATDTLVSSNLKPMYQDEFLIGLTHRMDDWTFGVRYINRRLKETLEDIAIDAAVNAYCEEKGIDCLGTSIWSGFHQYVLANPGAPVTVRLDGDSSLPGTTDVVTLSAADLRYPKPSRKYDAVEFTVNKAFNGTYGFDFSYTWQNLRGNYEGSVKSDNNQDDAGLTQDFDQPGLVDGAYGKLANGRRHTFKFYGSYKPTEWMTMGANLTVASPRQFSCIGVHPTDFFASLYGSASFFCANPLGNGGSTDSKLVSRGSAFKGEWAKNLDLGLQFQLPKTLGNSSFRVDVFNLLNWKQKLDFVEFGEDDSGALREDYRLVSGYQSPRSVRFTYTLRFGGK